MVSEKGRHSECVLLRFHLSDAQGQARLTCDDGQEDMVASEWCSAQDGEVEYSHRNDCLCRYMHLQEFIKFYCRSLYACMLHFNFKWILKDIARVHSRGAHQLVHGFSSCDHNTR
jgi:hypothetical protein